MKKQEATRKALGGAWRAKAWAALLSLAMILCVSLVFMPTAFAADEVKYLKPVFSDGKLTGTTERSVTEYTTVGTSTTAVTWSAGWYVVTGTDVTISQRITVSGDVHLILADGATLNAKQGITVAEGDSLTIYAQSTGTSMGTLIAKASDSYNSAGIGGTGANVNGGTITINGGNVTATGGLSGAGIGGGYNAADNGTFATGNNGNAIITASSISDNDDKSEWSGLISADGGKNYTLYGEDLSIRLGFDLTVAERLTIPESTDLTVAGLDLRNVTDRTLFALQDGGYAIFTPAVGKQGAKLELHGVRIKSGSIAAQGDLEIVLYGENVIVGSDKEELLIDGSGTLTVSAGEASGVLRLSASDDQSAMIRGDLDANDLIFITFNGVNYQWGGSVSGNLALNGVTQPTYYQDADGNRIFFLPDANSAKLWLYGVEIGNIIYSGDLTVYVCGNSEVESIQVSGALALVSDDTGIQYRLTVNEDLVAKRFENNVKLNVYGIFKTAAGETNVNNGVLNVSAGTGIESLQIGEESYIGVFGDTSNQFFLGHYYDGTVYALCLGVPNLDNISDMPHYIMLEEGFAIYLPDENVLELHDVRIESGEVNAIVTSGNLTIVLFGENTVISADTESGDAVAIYVGGELTVSGTGSLTVNAGKATENRASSIAIGVGGNLTINSGATVVANAGVAQYSIAVQTVGSLKFYGNLTANANNAVLNLSGTVSAEILPALSSVSIPIYAKEVLAADGGKLTVSYGSADQVYVFLTDDEKPTAANENITVVLNGKTYAWGGDVSRLGMLLTPVSVPTYYIADAKHGGTGYALFTPATETAAAKLELFDVTMQGDVLAIEISSALDLVLSGDSIIVMTEESNGSGALRTVGDLIVSGSGSLTAKALAGNIVAGVRVIDGDLTVKSGVTLTGVAKNGTEKNIGVDVDGDLTVESGATLYGVGDCEIYVEGNVTNEGSLSDETAPEATVKVGESEVKFSNLLHNGKEYFFKKEKIFAITATDTESYVKTVEYYIGAAALDSFDGIAWTAGEKIRFAPASVGEYRIYVRLTDSVGNSKIIVSPILVWYKDVKAEKLDTYFMHTGKDISTVIDLLGNALVTDEVGVTLVTADDKTTVTIDGDHLQSLGAGTHKFVLTLLPGGLDYVDGAINDLPASVVLTVTAEYSVPVKGTHYMTTALNADGWTNQNFVVTAKEGYLLSTAVDGEWAETLTVTEETANGTLKFYVKRTSDGAISKAVIERYKLDKTAPAIAGVTDGATYYTTQVYTVTDANLQTETVTVAGNRTLAYTRTFTDPAGNSTTVTFTLKPIASLTVTIDGLNTENVKSSDVETVKAVARAAAAVDTKTAADSEKSALASIASKCQALLAAVEAAKAESDRITEGTDVFVPDSVKSDDTETLEELLIDVEALLAGGNLTEDEAKELTETRDEIAEMLDVIETIETRMETVTGIVAKTDSKTVTADEYGKLTEALAEIEALLATDHLTEEQKKELESAKENAAEMQEILDSVRTAYEDLVKQTNSYASATVTTDDIPALETLNRALYEFLDSPHLTDEQAQTLSNRKSTIFEMLNTLTQLEKELAAIFNAVVSVDENSLKSFQKEDLEEAVQKAETLLAGGYLGEIDQKIMRITIEDGRFLIKQISLNDTEINRIKTEAAQFAAKGVKTSDKSTLEALIGSAETLLGGNRLTYTERDNLEVVKNKLNAYLYDIKQAEALAATDGIKAAQSITAENLTADDVEVVKKALDDLNSALLGGGDVYTASEKAAMEKQRDEMNDHLAAIASFNTFIDMVDRLPDVNGIVIDDPVDNANVEAAKAYYNAMSDELRAKIGAERESKLNGLIAALCEYESLHDTAPEWKQDSESGITFKANGYAKKVVCIMINGADVDPAMYTVREGSTVITLSSAYLEMLETGEHTLTILYTDGTVDVDFAVKHNTVWIPVLVLVLVIGATLVVDTVLLVKHYAKDEETAESKGSDQTDSEPKDGGKPEVPSDKNGEA